MKFEVGKQRVIVIDEETGDEVGRGVLKAAFYQIGEDRLSNESEIVVAADIPEAGEMSKSDGLGS